jgi:hypothetical protein
MILELTLRPSWHVLVIQDGDLIMQEAGGDAPTVTKEADKLADQDLEKESEETVTEISARVQEETDKERKKVAKKFA